MSEPIITTEAKRVGDEVRDYVRDRFVPGDLAQLDRLAEFVQVKVAEALEKSHGKFLCQDCFNPVDVERVRCRHCVDPTNTQSTT